MSESAPIRDVFDQLREPAELAGQAAIDGDAGRDQLPPGRRFRRAPTALAAVVMVATTGMSMFLGWRVKELTDIASAGRTALEAAQAYAVTLTNLDTADIDKNYRQALDGATGEFKGQYSQGSAHLRQILIDNKAMGTGVVVAAAVKSATKTKVDVLLFVDQSITNAVNPVPRIDRNRVEMTMEFVDSRWLASRVEII